MPHGQAQFLVEKIPEFISCRPGTCRIIGGMKRVVSVLIPVVLFLGPALLFAAPDDWAEGAPEHGDGANHTYFNRGGQLAWRNREGDWRDADGVPQGGKPFAVATIGVTK